MVDSSSCGSEKLCFSEEAVCKYRVFGGCGVLFRQGIWDECHD